MLENGDRVDGESVCWIYIGKRMLDTRQCEQQVLHKDFVSLHVLLSFSPSPCISLLIRPFPSLTLSLSPLLSLSELCAIFFVGCRFAFRPVVPLLANAQSQKRSFTKLLLLFGAIKLFFRCCYFALFYLFRIYLFVGRASVSFFLLSLFLFLSFPLSLSRCFYPMCHERNE